MPDIELHVDLSAPVRRVWTALTTSYGLRAWWWAQWEDVSVAVDARPGGEFRIAAETAGITVTGIYSEVNRTDGRLAFTWVWIDHEGSTVGEACEIGLSPLEDGCRLKLRHSGPWATAARGERYREEWSSLFEQLRGAVTREQGTTPPSLLYPLEP